MLWGAVVGRVGIKLSVEARVIALSPEPHLEMKYLGRGDAEARTEVGGAGS